MLACRVRSTKELHSTGQPLEGETRARMESRLGRDFSGVRVHEYAAAGKSSAPATSMV